MRLPAQAEAALTDYDCPGPECPMCNGEACALCLAGCGRDPKYDGIPCEHDVIERHIVEGVSKSGHENANRA
jgi:hypothetical protein